MHDVIRVIPAFLLAVIATASVASIVQTQLNLAAISDIGAPITLPIRAATTLEDLLRFGPVMAAITAGAFLPAFAVGSLVLRRMSLSRSAVFALAPIVGLWTAFFVMSFFTPMPQLVAAVRGSIGMALVCASGVAGGLIFERLTSREAR